MSDSSKCPFVVSFFQDDPDGSSERAGEGYYFQLDGEDCWSGPWSSAKQASNNAECDIATSADQTARAFSRANSQLLRADVALTAAQEYRHTAKATADVCVGRAKVADGLLQRLESFKAASQTLAPTLGR